MNALQIRMARAALRWTVQMLAQKTGISANTLSTIEVQTTLTPKRSTLLAIRHVFEAAGVEFLGENGVRVHGPVTTPPRAKRGGKPKEPTDE